MPKMVTELAQGQTFSRSADDAGVRDSSSRVFKAVLNYPGEQFSPQAACGVTIGSIHPYNTNLVCFDFNAKFDGDSRMAVIVTFNYKNFNSTAQSSNKGEQRNKSPDVRLATWTSDTSLYETPCISWRWWGSSADDNQNWVAPKNPAGDTYEGVTELQPITTFRIEQLTVADPQANTVYVGYINQKAVKLGSLTCNPHTLMLRNVAVSPHQETFGELLWKGYKVVYELAYRRNLTMLPTDPTDRNSTQALVEFGWDHAQIAEGHRVYNSGLGVAGVDARALALKHVNFKVQTAPYAYASDTQNTWVRAMVTIPAGDDGFMQRPATSPVAMNLDGTPRDLTTSFGGKYLAPLVLRYQKQMDADFSTVLGLRLPG